MVACLALALIFGFDDWSQATGEFQSAIAGSSVPKFAAAVENVAKDNSLRAVKILLGGLSTKRVEAYWILIAGLGKITSDEGIGEMERSLRAKGDPAVKRDLLMSLSLNPSKPATAALVKLIADGTPDLQVSAIDEVVRREVREAIPELIKLLSLEKKKGLGELARQARKGLVNLTGQDQGSPEAWQAWWEKNKGTFTIGEKASGDVDTVVATIKRNRALDFEELKKGKKEEVLILLGDYDGVQDIVDALKIPNSVCTRDAFGRQDLSKCKALIVNCTNYKGASRLKKTDLEKVREFVFGGGYLFTSDWGLADVVEEAFPGYIQRGGETAEFNTLIYPKKGSSVHPFLREVFSKPQGDRLVERKIDHSWQIDAQSYAVAYDASRVVALIEAPELQAAGQPTAVAVTFTVGPGATSTIAMGGVYEDLPQQKGGKVLHVLSHFSKQKNKHDGYTLQNMLLNFLIEAKDRKHILERK